MQKYLIKEQIRKKVARSGNSGAVWIPKNWLGEEVIVTRLETPKLSLEEEIINIVLPYLRGISGIFLYGSYARKEETKDSDIDVLIIVEHKFKAENTKKFDIEVIEIKKIKEAVQKNPFVYAIINEAKPVINSALLDELKQSKKDFKSFINWFKETTKDSIKSTEELIELDKLESNYLTSYSVIYSLILRLRGVFLISLLLNNKSFSNYLFKKFILKHISEHEFNKVCKVYRGIRDNKKIENLEIEINTADKLLEVLRKEVENLNAK